MPRVIPPVPGHLLTADFYWRNAYYQVYRTTMHYNVSGSAVPTYPQLLAWANDQFGAVMGEVDDIQDHDVLGTQVRARYENNEGFDMSVFSDSDAIAGAMGTIVDDAGEEIESLPPQGALCLRKFTDKGGRQNRGHLFIPFISEQVQHDGILDTLNLPAVRQICTALMTPTMLAGAACTPALWNRKENKLVDIVRIGAVQFISHRDDRKFKEPPLYIIPA